MDPLISILVFDYTDVVIHEYVKLRVEINSKIISVVKYEYDEYFIL